MSKFDSNTLWTSVEIGCSTAIAMTCVYNCVNSFANIYSLVDRDDAVATTINSVFPRTLAIVCLVSRIVIVYKGMNDFPEYKSKIEAYALKCPATKREHVVWFAATIVFAYAAFILPSNAYRIYLIHQHLHDVNVLLFFTMMYVQNMSICSIEIHFVVRCFALYQLFRSINEDMAALKLETINARRYPAALKPDEIGGVGPRPDDDDDNGVLFHTHEMSDVVEQLRMRHQFVRGAFVDLNGLYGVSVGMSIFLLFVLTLFDIYGVVFVQNTNTRPQILVYGWLLQYWFRLFAISMTTHFTTKQVCGAITYYYIGF